MRAGKIGWGVHIGMTVIEIDGQLYNTAFSGDTATSFTVFRAEYLLSEMLTRAPVEAIVQFLSVTRELGDPSALFEHEPAVVALIETAYPRRTWATKMDLLKKELAADDASWSVWAAQWSEEFGATGKVALDALVQAGKAAGQVGLGLADAVATLLRWTPYVLGGAVLLGVVVVANRK